MNAREQKEYVEDGLSTERRRQFLIADQVALEWQQAHPWSFVEYFEFLEALQDIFGPLPHSREPWTGNDFRL